MTQPKQLTYRETIEQELRALRRLRDKRLCCGPLYAYGACCAVGALKAHARNADSIDDLEQGVLGPVRGPVAELRFLVDRPARGDIIYANENFCRSDNSPSAQRARYAYMVQWCLDKLAEPQSVSA